MEAPESIYQVDYEDFGLPDKPRAEKALMIICWTISGVRVEEEVAAGGASTTGEEASGGAGMTGE